MLSKGEVEEIIIRPDIEIVTIILYEGAIIKGKKVDNRTYHMNVVDINKFEDKLREAERRLGIQDGVPITFERGTDTAGKLLVSLLIVAILISLLARSKSIRPPINMDTFVKLIISNCELIIYVVFLDSTGARQIHPSRPANWSWKRCPFFGCSGAQGGQTRGDGVCGLLETARAL